MKMKNVYYLLFLSAIVGYVYDIVLDGVSLSQMNPANTSPRLRSSSSRERAMNERERLLAVARTTFEECVDQGMHAIDCKEFIDGEIINTFTGLDQYIQTKIVGKRSEDEEYYNAVVIQMSDEYMTLGRDGDGVIYYDFPWDSDGTAVTPQEDADIPAIVATDTVEAAESLVAETSSAAASSATEPPAPTPPAPTTDDGFLEPVPPPPPAASSAPPPPPPPPPASSSSSYASSYASSTSYYGSSYDDDYTYTPPPPSPGTSSGYSSATSPAGVDGDLYLLDDEAKVGGATLAEAVDGTDKPLAGGVLVTNVTSTDTPEAEAELLETLNSPDDIPEAGPRMIAPISCAGLTGPHCCLKVKKTVRDRDKNHKAIQCFMDFAEGTIKKNMFKNLHKGKKVMIYANHNDKVSKHPKITGSWKDVESGIGEGFGVPKGWSKNK